MKTKTFTATATCKDGRFVMSTSSVDRDGDMILQNWEVKGHVPMLWSHDPHALPIGYVAEISSNDKETTFVPAWPEEGVYPFADQVRKLTELGFIKSLSPGFIPLTTEEPTDDERKQMGPNGMKITSAELLEVSVVNIPANAQALIASGGKGICPIYRARGTGVEIAKGMDRKKMEAWMTRITKEAPAAEKAEDPMAAIDAVIAALQGDVTPEIAAECVSQLQAFKEANMAEETTEPEIGGGKSLGEKEIAAIVRKTLAEIADEDPSDELLSDDEKLAELIKEMGE